MSNAKDQQQMKMLHTKVQELESQFAELKGEVTGLSTKDLQDKLVDITQALDKKAPILELKKLYGTFDASNSRFEDVKKEIAEMQKGMKLLEENEDLKSLKLKFTSMENKLMIGLKNIKDLQAKVSETMTFQIMPQSQQANEDEKKEEKMNQFMDETNEKVNKIKDSVTQFKTDFNNLTRSVEEKIETKAAKEALVDLESMCWISTLYYQ